MYRFEYALSSPYFSDTNIGYSKYVDVNSFIDFYIINELAKDIDALETIFLKNGIGNVPTVILI